MKTLRNFFALIAAYALGVLSVIDYEQFKQADTFYYTLFALSIIMVFILTIINLEKDESIKKFQRKKKD